jgi:thiosulfate reductase/polysulfide reductase chain A
MSELDRRKFLEFSAASLMSAEVSAEATAAPSPSEGVWIPTCCQMCGGQTGIRCQVVNGRVVKIEPNDENPVGLANVSSDFFAHKHEGAVMCPKGNAGIMALYDPDRVKRPLKRTNPEKGPGVDPHWEEMSWEEAFDRIALQLRALREAGQSHKLLWFSEDSSWIAIQQDFCELYGTPNFFMHSSLCDVNRKASMKLVCGYDRPLIDAANSKYMLIFGWNPLSATKWSHLPRIITRGIENGAKLVVVDPNFSYTAAKAQEWISIRPGTDGAMALALAHVIIRDKLYDEEFVREWTVGFEAFATYVRDKTPAWAEKISNAPASTIERVAHEFATTKPALVDVWSGTHHSNGVQAGRAIGLLGTLVGGFDRPGTLIIPERKGPARVKPKVLPVHQVRFDGYPERLPFGHAAGDYTEIVNRIVEKRGPYEPRMAMILFQNPAMSVPGTRRVIEALKRLDFVVVADTHLSETAELADIVLPGTTYLERYELSVPWVTWTVVALRQPVVPPLFGQPPEYDIIIELGKRLGLKDADGREYFAGLRYEDYLDRLLQNGTPKLTLAELRGLPGAVWVDPKGTVYEKHRRELPAEKLKGTVIEGAQILDKPRIQGGKVIGLVSNGKSVQGFPTPSGKIEFASDWLSNKTDSSGRTVAALPVFEPRDWQPSADYPLFLINWKEASHTHTRTMNNPWLMEQKGSNPLLINRKTAEKLGLKDGDTVWVESPHSRDKAVAKVTEAIHPEVVGWQHGFGHWAMGQVAKGKGTNTGQFLATKSDALSGQSLNKECCVRVTKA